METAAQKEFLTQKGCHYGQGYLFGHAIAGERVQAFIQEAEQKRLAPGER